MKNVVLIALTLFLGLSTSLTATENTFVFENMTDVENLAKKIVEIGDKTSLSCSCVSCSGKCGDVYTLANMAEKINVDGFAVYDKWIVKFVDMGAPGWNDPRDTVVFEFFQDGELTVWASHYDGTVSLMPDLVLNQFGAEAYKSHVKLTLSVLKDQT
jgi:hypothetical protein